MYIGLFMIIPFLNTAYHGLKSKHHKQILILSAMFAGFPLLTNAFSMDHAGWWRTAFYQRGSQVILPDFWITGYPIMYFFIGAYLSEYKPHIKTRYLFTILLCNIVLAGTFLFYSSNGGNFARGPWEDWGSPFNVITSLCVFLMVTNIKTDTWNLKWKAFLKYASSLCLGTYLLSWIFDSTFYPILNAKISYMPDRLYYSIPIVLTVFLCSLLLSALIQLIYTLIHFTVKNCKIIHPNAHS